MAADSDVAAPDEQAVDAFTGRVLGDTAAAATVFMAALGDRLGLFKQLAEHGPADSAALADRAGCDERYVREWLRGMTAASYLTREPDGRFALPAAHAPVLAVEPGPAFFGGVHQELLGALQGYHELVDAFRQGGGIAPDQLDEDVWVGTSRFTAQWHQNMLVQLWLPLLPEVRAKLEAGARVADVGTGSGHALRTLAQHFPNGTYVGYDENAGVIDRAEREAEATGLADSLRFEVRDAAAGLPEKFDVITTFDMLHDAVDPLALLTSIRDALEPDGVYVCLDINCADDPDQNSGPIATLLYGFSLLYCMTTSLARGGAGLGTLGLPEAKLRELAAEAGFSEVRRVEMENPFNNLYVLR
ncbi:class I SAM-dependent methyltransferase [Catenulispora subtropica]|uniref:Class I SAM-dependent methyltransferase n=1 Tax=Catenulispora subtropica TaxID=450798 RepID=A0ABP5D2X7_9ACTN